MFRRKSKNQKFVNAEDLTVGAIIRLCESDYMIIHFDASTALEPVAIVYAAPLDDDGYNAVTFDINDDRSLTLIVPSKTPFTVLK